MLELAHLYKPMNAWNLVQGIVKEPLGLYRMKIPSQGVKFQMWDSETRILVANRLSDYSEPIVRFHPGTTGHLICANQSSGLS